MRGGRAFCCSALLVIFIALKGPHGNIFHLNKGLNAHTTVWSAFSGRSSSTSQENHVQDARPVWSLSHGLTVAFLNINGVHSIYYFRRPALVCTVFLHGKIKRTKRPCAYYSNSSATFHCTLEGDLVFKLNPGPVNNGHCTQRRHASIDRRVLQSRRNPSNLIDVNNLSRGIPLISYRINDLPIRSPRCRNINKSIDISSLRDDLSKSDLCSNAIDSLELNDLVTHYDEALSSALDRHAPLINKTVTKRPIVPWFNNEIKTAKRMRRRAERKWRKTKLRLDFLDYKAKKNRATFEMKKARQEFYTDFIAENSHDTRKLFRSAKTLFNHESELHFQGYSDSNATLANDIGNFFIKKVGVIRTGLDTAAGNIHSADEMFPRNPEIHSLFQDFITLTDKEVSSLITKATKKTCSLDPMPTTLVVECLDVLLPVLTKMINLSLQSGCFADRWKHADVHPKLKKPKAEVIFPNLRPISNLTFVSKLTECAAFSQTHNHLTIHDLYPKAQSSYRECHSTETALLRIKNDILMNMNRQHLTLLVLLDLSAAFDTVDHAILLNRLKSDFGISGNVLSWFKSYLYQRSQSVSINGHTSKKFEVKCGVPQGSCLGPLLFVLYASKLFTIIERHLPQVHAYADDTQLYVAFKPDPEHATNAVAAMEACINDIRKWMLADRLKINDDKTEFLVIGTRQQLAKVNIDSINVGTVEVSSSSEVKNLGCWLDNQLKLNSHINRLCKSAFLHLYNIRKIRKFLSRETTQILVNALVTSRLDYCNSILYGLPATELYKLQRVQNSAARLICNVGRFDHISPSLKMLHWLPIEFRIQFKILLITFKAIHGLAPAYLIELITLRTQ